MATRWTDSVEVRAARHAVLAEPLRLAMLDALTTTDRSPGELCAQFGINSNLLAHHVRVLVDAGLLERIESHADRRRTYLRLVHHPDPIDRHPLRAAVLFLCTRNSARSQLAAALWQQRTGGRAASAGTDPAIAVHEGALAAARRAGLELAGARPRRIGRIAGSTQVITVCDRAHEDLGGRNDWLHWSIADPVAAGTPQAFDEVVAELDHRIRRLAGDDRSRGPHT